MIRDALLLALLFGLWLDVERDRYGLAVLLVGAMVYLAGYMRRKEAL